MTIDSCLSSNGYLTYIGILLIARKNESAYFVRSDMLSYLLTRKYPPIKQIVKNIDDGIIELAEKQIIVISQSYKPHEWIIDTDTMKIDDEKDEKKYYTVVDEKEIQKIITSNDKHYTRSVSLVKFYVYVLSTIFKKKGECMGVGFTSSTEMCDALGINIKTVLSYLGQLEELKLLYIYHACDSILFENGDIREISHTYGRYQDKEKIIQIGRKHEEEYGMKIKATHTKINKENGNITRALSHKFKHVVNCVDNGNDIPYPYEECKDIYLSMLDYNSRYRDRKERIKDLSVFNGFDFYNQ